MRERSAYEYEASMTHIPERKPKGTWMKNKQQISWFFESFVWCVTCIVKDSDEGSGYVGKSGRYFHCTQFKIRLSLLILNLFIHYSYVLLFFKSFVLSQGLFFKTTKITFSTVFLISNVQSLSKYHSNRKERKKTKETS